MAFELDEQGHKLRDYVSLLRDFYGILRSPSSLEDKEFGMVKSRNVNEATWKDLDFLVSAIQIVHDAGIEHSDPVPHTVIDIRSESDMLTVGGDDPDQETLEAYKGLAGEGLSGTTTHSELEGFDEFLLEWFTLLKSSHSSENLNVEISKINAVDSLLREHSISPENSGFILSVTEACIDANLDYENITGEVISPDDLTVETEELIDISSEIVEESVSLSDKEKLKSLEYSSQIQEKSFLYGGAAAEDIAKAQQKELRLMDSNNTEQYIDDSDEFFFFEKVKEDDDPFWEEVEKISDEDSSIGAKSWKIFTLSEKYSVSPAEVKEAITWLAGEADMKESYSLIEEIEEDSPGFLDTENNEREIPRVKNFFKETVSSDVPKTEIEHFYFKERDAAWVLGGLSGAAFASAAFIAGIATSHFTKKILSRKKSPL